MIAYVKKQSDWKPLPKDAGMFTKQRLDRLNGQANGEKVDALRTELQRTVHLHAGVFHHKVLKTCWFPGLYLSLYHLFFLFISFLCGIFLKTYLCTYIILCTV